MKSTHFVSAFLLAALACANSDRSFYAKVKENFVPVNILSTEALDFISLNESNLSPSTKFTLKNGVATTRDSKIEKVFGVLNGYIVIGSKETVTPLNLRLNRFMKVKNHQPHLCRFFNTPNGGLLMDKDYSSVVLKCHQLEVYFLSPSEADIQESGFRGRHKRETEEDFVPEEKGEQMKSESESESALIGRNAKRHIPVSAPKNKLESHTSSIDDSVTSTLAKPEKLPVAAYDWDSDVSNEDTPFVFW